MDSILKELGIKSLSSGLECYDKLLCKGVPSKIITIDAGSTRCYKTLLNLQKAFSFIKQTSAPCCYVDTEGGALITIAYWKDKFEKRFETQYKVAEAVYEDSKWKLNTKNESLENTLVVVTVRDIFKLFTLHGTPIDFKITEEGGRIDVKRLPVTDSLEISIGKRKVTTEELPIELTPIGQLLTEINPCGVIYDSILELFKQRMPSTRENFPSRGYLLHNLLGCMQRIAETYSIPVIGIAHTSKDPARKYSEKISAETILSYNCKFITLFRTVSESVDDIRREITIWRHQGKPPFSEKYIIAPTDKGIDEIEQKE